jgi:hypothetical protein
MYAQNISCQIFDDSEYLTGISVSKAYTGKDTASAILLAKRDALSEAIATIAQKKSKAVASVISSYETGHGMDNRSKSASRSASKDTFDLDDVQVVCLKTEHAENGIIAHIAVCLSRNSLVNKENDKIRNLVVTETVSEIYRDVDEDKNSIGGESRLQIESSRKEQITSKEHTKILFNPSGAKKFYEMAAQEDFDDRKQFEDKSAIRKRAHREKVFKMGENKKSK